MAKLTKSQTRAHEAACHILRNGRPLSEGEILAVIDGWHEGATNPNTRASAYFTPWDLAKHVSLEMVGGEILDLCSGIGTLSIAHAWYHGWDPSIQITMVESNPDYAAVAKRLMPKANVIVGSVFDRGLMAELAARRFDTVVSNPPYGRFSRGAKSPRYTGAEAHYQVIDIASDMIAETGVFLLPQGALPWSFSGKRSFEWAEKSACREYDRFFRETGIELGHNIGIDTSVLPGFRDVSVMTEIAVVDYSETKMMRAGRGAA